MNKISLQLVNMGGGVLSSKTTFFYCALEIEL
mgnify:CR=1 FL=1